eukprot:2960236-Alexandrium_andersonii.AAC.1
MGQNSEPEAKVAKAKAKLVKAIKGAQGVKRSGETVDMDDEESSGNGEQDVEKMARGRGRATCRGRGGHGGRAGR